MRLGWSLAVKYSLSHFISIGVKAERLKGDAYKHHSKKSITVKKNNLPDLLSLEATAK
jgi:hypothetical protein